MSGQVDNVDLVDNVDNVDSGRDEIVRQVHSPRGLPGPHCPLGPLVHWVHFLLLILLVSCSWKPNSVAYREFYKHLEEPIAIHQMQETDYYVVFFVDAPHLDYTDNCSLLRTIVRHPSNGSRRRDVGHAWISLHGIEDGKKIVVEGGHSGELGIAQPKYFDGIMDLIEEGDANPIKYLWATLHDGFFQEGAGMHRPTFAAKVGLTKEQFEKIMTFISPENYNYHEYSLTRSQCSTFVAQVALLAGLKLEHEVTIEIDETIIWTGRMLPLRCDEKYSLLTISTPDVLERSLMTAVGEGQAVAIPMACSPLSTCRVTPVIADASGDARNAAL